MTKSGIHNNASLLIRTITIINIIVSLFTIKLLLLEYRAILHLFQYNIKKRKLTYSSFKCVGRQWKSQSGGLVQIFPSLNACTSLNAYTNRHEQTQQIYMHTHTHTQVATPTRLLFLCVLISAISGGYSYLRTRTHFPLCGSLFSLLSLWNSLFCGTHMAADWP